MTSSRITALLLVPETSEPRPAASLERDAEALRAGGCGDVVVVQRPGPLRDLLRAGLTALAGWGRQMPGQALLHLADENVPALTSDTVATLLAAAPVGAAGAGNDARVRAGYRESGPGWPVLVGQDHWMDLLGTTSPEAWFRRVETVEIQDPAGPERAGRLPALIALDVDGTLMSSDHAPLPSTTAALARARAAGVRVALASGRDPHGLATIADRLGWERDGLMFIGNNGSRIVDAATGRVLWSADVPTEARGRLTDHAATLPIATSLPEGPRLWTTDATDRVVQIEARSNGQELLEVADLREVPAPVTKVLFTGPPEQLRAVAPGLRAPFEPEFTFAFAAPFYLDATYGPVDKGVALRHVCEVLGIDLADTVAFGDNENDVGMLRTAGLGVAMGNGVPMAKEAADLVTADHNSDGIALALQERFGL